MDSRWTKHLRDDEDKQRFYNSLMGSRPVLERIQDLLTEWETQADKSLQLTSSYDSPNWALKAADRNGFNRAISNLKQLINLDQQKVRND